MDAQEQSNTQHSPGGGKSHVCTKCGWNYPNPHPSAKNRRAHKKICGTIKGFEILDSEKPNQNLDLQKQVCLDDEPKTPSPRVVEKADERIGDVIEEDVFADAVCEFSSSLVSDSVKEKEETPANAMATDLGETQQCNKKPEVIRESCDVPYVEDFPSSVEAAIGGESQSDSLIEQSREAQAIHGGLETECKGNVVDESEAKVASALGKRMDTSVASSWNDEVIYSDLEGPHVEEMIMNPPAEADYTVNDKIQVDTPNVETNADHTSEPALVGIPFAEVSLLGTKGLEEFKSNHYVNPFIQEAPKGEECETATLTQAEDGLSIRTEVPLEDKTEHQDQTCLVDVKGFPSGEDIVMSNIDLEDSKMKAEEGESSLGASQETVESETLRTFTPAVYPIVADSDADVSHASNKTGVADLITPESELIQENVEAEEKSAISELSSESSCGVEHYVSPVSVVLEGDDPSITGTSKDSILQISAEACKSSDEDCITPDDSGKATNQKLLESGRTEFNRVVGGLGVIQANEIDGNIKAHDIYAEVPVTIESNDHRDFGRLQNLSEEHIRSLVLSPLVTRDNASNAISGHSEGVNKPENESQSSPLAVALSDNEEITMEKTRSWSRAKEQHVPLKNLLNEARSPRLVAAEANNIQRVSSILDEETSPEEEGGWPERREVSEEWNTPAKYPVERKVKGRPFWVPFVCCSSAAK